MIELPTLSLATVALLVGIVLSVILLQPVLFGWSTTAVGEKKIGYLASVVALIVAGMSSAVASLFYSFTLGLLMMKLGQVPFALGGLAVSWLAAGFVYSGFLRVPVMRGVQVAAVYWLASGVLTAVIGLILKLVF